MRQDRTGQVWLHKVHPQALLLIVGPGRDDEHEDFCHPALDLETGEFDRWYESGSFKDWETHEEYERIA